MDKNTDNSRSSIMLPKPAIRLIKMIAIQEGISIAQLVNKMFEAYIKNKKGIEYVKVGDSTKFTVSSTATISRSESTFINK